MALTEEDLSAMLQPSYPSEGLVSMSLVNAMLSSSSAMDAPLPYPSPLQRAHSMCGPAVNMNQYGVPERPSGSGSSASQWLAEQWEVDCKNEVLDRAGYGAAQQQPSNINSTQGLQRYHSAPSSFLESLALFGEDDFAHITNPLHDGRVKTYFNENLAPINENLVPIMESAEPLGWASKEPEKLDEQYFASGKQSAALRASEVNPRSSLLRQSSSSAELLQSEDERAAIRPLNPKALFSQPTYAFNDAVMGAGEIWKMPARVRFPEEMTDDDSTSDLLVGDDRSRLRQQSLPSPSSTGGDGTDLAEEDLLDVFASCKTRARRGYATHPRSIAERNRRSRISERMKKLQDLVPNMDKQTNTAEMLDEAVEYVKFLQDQVKDLSETIVRLKNGIRQQQQSAAS